MQREVLVTQLNLKMASKIVVMKDSSVECQVWTLKFFSQDVCNELYLEK